MEVKYLRNYIQNIESFIYLFYFILVLTFLPFELSFNRFGCSCILIYSLSLYYFAKSEPDSFFIAQMLYNFCYQWGLGYFHLNKLYFNYVSGTAHHVWYLKLIFSSCLLLCFFFHVCKSVLSDLSFSNFISIPSGTRIKTRKRNIAAPLDPAAFSDAVVQIYLDNAGDLVM